MTAATMEKIGTIAGGVIIAFVAVFVAWNLWQSHQADVLTQQAQACKDLAGNRSYVWTPTDGCLMDFGGFGNMTKVNP